MAKKAKTPATETTPGETVAATPKETPRITFESGVLDDGAPVVTAVMRNGNKHTLNIATSGLTAKLAIHGAQQKLADKLASAGTKGWSDDDCDATIAELTAQLQRGEWSTKREGTGESGAGMLAKAVMEVFKIDRAAAIDKLSKLTNEQKTSLRAFGPIKSVTDRLKAEADAKKAPVAADTIAAMGFEVPA